MENRYLLVCYEHIYTNDISFVLLKKYCMFTLYIINMIIDIAWLDTILVGL